jgi:uncharacterized membrane protein YkoI
MKLLMKLPMKTVLFIMLLAFPIAGLCEDIDHDDAYRLQQSGEILPLERILEKARQYHDGKVLEVELEKRRKAFVYEIKILDNEGILWEMKINAMDGTVVSEEEED